MNAERKADNRPDAEPARVSSVAQVSILNADRSRRVPRNRKGQSRRALCLLRGTDGSNPPPSCNESLKKRHQGARKRGPFLLGGTDGSNPCTLQSGHWLVGIVDWPNRAGLPGVA
jgi:hypothetical protein